MNLFLRPKKSEGANLRLVFSPLPDPWKVAQ